MDTEPHIETETNEKPHIPYKYENAKDSDFHPQQYNNSVEVSESSGDIMKKINEEANKLNTIVDKNDLKIFSKYEDLNEEQLKSLINEKNDTLIKLNSKKEESKEQLNSLLKEINQTITDNAEILYKENIDKETIVYLQNEIEIKKKELKYAKGINHSTKTQYNALNNKLNNKTDDINGKDNETQINNLKNENKKLQLDIRKYKDDSVTNKIEVKKITDNIVYPNKIKEKSDEIRNLTNSKLEYYNKIKMSIKSLDNVITEISHLEDIAKKKDKEEKDENLNNKIKYWVDLIRSDLNGTQDEIVERIEKDNSNFIKEINKTEEKNNVKRLQSPTIRANKDSNYNIRKSSDLNLLYKKNNNINPKSILGKYNYLKQRQNSSYNNKYKLNKIYFSSEEIKNNKLKNNDNAKIDVDKIIQKDYEDTTDSEYRELLDKRTKYLETNVRLEKNIKEIEKTKKSKMLNISMTVQENEKRLKELKAQNDLLEKEINNLYNLYQLTIDKERLKLEIKEKEKKKKIEENKNKEQPVVETPLPNENIVQNELKESKDLAKNKNVTEPKKKLSKSNKNRSGYVDDYVVDKNIAETREQRLQKIRQKYLYDDNNEKEEIKEQNYNINLNNENNTEKNEQNGIEDNNVINNDDADKNNINEENNEIQKENEDVNNENKEINEPEKENVNESKNDLELESLNEE